MDPDPRDMTTIFADDATRLEMRRVPVDGTLQDWADMRLRVRGYGVTADIDNAMFEEDIRALRELMAGLLDDPESMDGFEVDGGRGPGFSVLGVFDDDGDAVECTFRWHESWDDPQVGVVFSFAWTRAELEASVAAVDAVLATYE